jgi:predicted transcriptional regulator
MTYAEAILCGLALVGLAVLFAAAIVVPFIRFEEKMGARLP